LAATHQSGTITQGDWKIISEETWTIKDTNERKTFNFSVHKTRQEQRDHALRPKMGWNGFSWLRTGISG
jgi:hypothetical protein